MDECSELHVFTDFRVLVVSDNKGARDLADWYQTIFVFSHPGCESDFDLSFTTDHDGDKILEISQFNPMFSIDSLISMFQAYQVEIKPNKSQLTVVPN